MGGWNTIDRKISGIFWLKYSPSYPRASAKLDLVYLKNLRLELCLSRSDISEGKITTHGPLWSGGMISISNIWIKMNFTETDKCSVTSFNAGWPHRGGILFIKIFFMPWQIFLYQGSSSNEMKKLTGLKQLMVFFPLLCVTRPESPATVFVLCNWEMIMTALVPSSNYHSAPLYHHQLFTSDIIIIIVSSSDCFIDWQYLSL